MSDFSISGNKESFFVVVVVSLKEWNLSHVLNLASQSNS